MKVSPRHSSQSDVYHDNDQCTERNNIETKYLTHGTGESKTLCKNCKRLNDEGK